jgi:hypothetical protein
MSQESLTMSNRALSTYSDGGIHSANVDKGTVAGIIRFYQNFSNTVLSVHVSNGEVSSSQNRIITAQPVHFFKKVFSSKIAEKLYNQDSCYEKSLKYCKARTRLSSVFSC